MHEYSFITLRTIFERLPYDIPVITLTALFCSFCNLSSKQLPEFSYTMLQQSKWRRIIKLSTLIRVCWGTNLFILCSNPILNWRNWRKIAIFHKIDKNCNISCWSLATARDFLMKFWNFLKYQKIDENHDSHLQYSIVTNYTEVLKFILINLGFLNWWKNDITLITQSW